MLDSSLELIALLARIKLQTRAVCRRGSSKSRRSAARPTDLVGGGWGVADMLDAAVHKWPDRPFMVLAGSGEAVTFAELDARANRVARWLRDTLHVPLPYSIRRMKILFLFGRDTKPVPNSYSPGTREAKRPIQVRWK